jgi:hypothetical protein
VKSLLAILVHSWGFILFAGVPFEALRADSIPELVARSKPAIIEIVAFDSQNKPIKSGTGFFITADGVAVTNSQPPSAFSRSSLPSPFSHRFRPEQKRMRAGRPTEHRSKPRVHRDT